MLGRIWYVVLAVLGLVAFDVNHCVRIGWGFEGFPTPAVPAAGCRTGCRRPCWVLWAISASRERYLWTRLAYGYAFRGYGGLGWGLATAIRATESPWGVSAGGRALFCSVSSGLF